MRCMREFGRMYCCTFVNQLAQIRRRGTHSITHYLFIIYIIYNPEEHRSWHPCTEFTA